MLKIIRVFNEMLFNMFLRLVSVLFLMIAMPFFLIGKWFAKKANIEIHYLKAFDDNYKI